MLENMKCTSCGTTREEIPPSAIDCQVRLLNCPNKDCLMYGVVVVSVVS